MLLKITSKQTATRKQIQPLWQKQLRHCVTTVDELAKALQLTSNEFDGARRAEQMGLPLRITPYYLSLCDPQDPTCPVRLQCVPQIDESKNILGDLKDPLGEVNHEVAPHLVQRYPDRVLLLATDRCAVYCRFCTRSRMVGDGGGAIAMQQLEPAMLYIQNHPEVSDVIISGGDPLTMSTDRIVRLLRRIRQIPTVETIRIATRAPVTLPQRVTTELVHALSAFHPIWIMTHFNHPKELTSLAEKACVRFVNHGFPVMNQTVLLKGINDNSKTLSTLFRSLVRSRVRPYYLLQADPVQGTGHLRTPLGVGVQIMEELQGRLTGIALPKFIVDTPGGMGKVPIVPNYIVTRDAGKTTFRTHRCGAVEYFDPPVY